MSATLNLLTSLILFFKNLFEGSYKWVGDDEINGELYIKYSIRFKMVNKSKPISFFAENPDEVNKFIRNDRDNIMRKVILFQFENNDGFLCDGLITGQIVIYSNQRDDINLRAKELSGHIENLSFVVKDESMHATDAYIGSLVGHGDNCLRDFVQESMTWANCLPLSAVYAGQQYCPNPDYPKNSPPLCYALTQGSNIYRFNNFVSDVGHLTCLGPTGAGKTTLIEFFLSQHRKYPNSRQIFIGKDRSAEVAILAHGGAYFSLDDDQSNKLALSPIANLDTVFDRDWVRAWLEDCFEINHIKLTAEMRAEISAALDLLAKQDKEHRKLGNLTFQNEILRRAFQAMNVGSFKSILSGENDNIFTNDCIGFDLTQVMSLKKEVSIPIILAILNTLTIKFQDKKPTLLILDEAWLLLDNPIFTAKLKDWLKTLRKFNVSVIFSSQSLSDVFNSDIASVIIESCPTKIFLPNEMANSEESKQYYKRYSLNQAEIDLIAQAQPKSQYYIVQPQGKRLADIELSQVALKFIGVNPSKEHPQNKLFFEYFDRDNPNWIIDYLNASAQKEAADFVKNYMVAA